MPTSTVLALTLQSSDILQPFQYLIFQIHEQEQDINDSNVYESLDGLGFVLLAWELTCWLNRFF